MTSQKRIICGSDVVSAHLCALLTSEFMASNGNVKSAGDTNLGIDFPPAFLRNSLESAASRISGLLMGLRNVFGPISGLKDCLQCQQAPFITRELCWPAYGSIAHYSGHFSSKALWLRYPHDVPIFDSFVQRALWVIAKLEESSFQPCNSVRNLSIKPLSSLT